MALTADFISEIVCLVSMCVQIGLASCFLHCALAAVQCIVISLVCVFVGLLP